MARGRFAADSG